MDLREDIENLMKVLEKELLNDPCNNLSVKKIIELSKMLDDIIDKYIKV